MQRAKIDPSSKCDKLPCTITSHGYLMYKIPEHPHAFSNGYVYAHRYLIEQSIGRYLSSDEIVHHKDGDKLNNDLSNLQLVHGIANHKLEHRTKQKNLRLPGEDNPIVECACGCGIKFKKYDGSNRVRRFVPGHNRKGTGKKNSMERIKCACGCGEEIFRYDKYGRERRYISGHNITITMCSNAGKSGCKKRWGN